MDEETREIAETVETVREDDAAALEAMARRLDEALSAIAAWRGRGRA